MPFSKIEPSFTINCMTRFRQGKTVEVWLALLLFESYQSHECRPAQTTLSQIARCSVKTVTRCIKELESFGLISKRREGRGMYSRTIYTVRHPESTSTATELMEQRFGHERSKDPDMGVQDPDMGVHESGHRCPKDPDRPDIRTRRSELNESNYISRPSGFEIENFTSLSTEEQAPSSDPEISFDEFYTAYPRQDGWLKAKRATERAIELLAKERFGGNRADASRWLFEREVRFAKSPLVREKLSDRVQARYIPALATWMSNARYDDDDVSGWGYVKPRTYAPVGFVQIPQSAPVIKSTDSKPVTATQQEEALQTAQHPYLESLKRKHDAAKERQEREKLERERPYRELLAAYPGATTGTASELNAVSDAVWRISENRFRGDRAVALAWLLERAKDSKEPDMSAETWFLNDCFNEDLDFSFDDSPAQELST